FPRLSYALPYLFIGRAIFNLGWHVSKLAPRRQRQTRHLSGGIYNSATSTEKISGKPSAMRVHDVPSSRLTQISPPVVPKYKPSGSRVSLFIAWRLTVYQPFVRGRPSSWRFQVLPA